MKLPILVAFELLGCLDDEIVRDKHIMNLLRRALYQKDVGNDRVLNITPAELREAIADLGTVDLIVLRTALFKIKNKITVLSDATVLFYIALMGVVQEQLMGYDAF